MLLVFNSIGSFINCMFGRVNHLSRFKQYNNDTWNFMIFYIVISKFKALWVQLHSHISQPIYNTVNQLSMLFTYLITSYFTVKLLLFTQQTHSSSSVTRPPSSLSVRSVTSVRSAESVLTTRSSPVRGPTAQRTTRKPVGANTSYGKSVLCVMN